MGTCATCTDKNTEDLGLLNASKKKEVDNSDHPTPSKKTSKVTAATSKVKKSPEEAVKSKEPEPPRERTEDDMEREVNKMLVHEEEILRKRSRPLLDRRTTVEVEELLASTIFGFKSKEEQAALIIQRGIRRKLAVLEMKARQDWLVSSFY